jgi:GNAT superfamily N-acetyltransferase
MVGLDKHTDDVAELRRMSVHESVRRHGIAKLLLMMFEDFAKEQGYKEIMLTTLNAQVPAIRAYEKAGFSFAGEQFFDAAHLVTRVELRKSLSGDS